MEEVSKPSFLGETEAAHLHYDLSSKRSFASNRTQIYLPCELLCLGDKRTLNKST